MPANQDTIRVFIHDLSENMHTFYVKTFDAKGNVSIPCEISGKVYGNNYISGLTNREIANAVRTGQEGLINWSAKTTDLLFNEVRYKTGSGETNILRVWSGESSIVCPDVKTGERFEYRSVFLPDKGMDTIKLAWTEAPFLYKYPKTGWTVSARGGYFDWGGELGGQPYRVVDNDLNTVWHSDLAAQLPHCLVIDMLERLLVYNMEIFRHPEYRYAQTIQIYLSDTEVMPDQQQESWGTPVAEGVFTGTSVSLKLELPENQRGRYLIVYFPDSSTPPYMICVEIDVYGL
jgi:hypothetical protein